VLYWDDIMELVFFLVVSLLISALRSSLQREKEMANTKEVMKDDWPVTFSIGMVTFLHLPATVDAMLKRADDLMYSVKASGKGAIRHEVGGDEPGVCSCSHELW